MKFRVEINGASLLLGIQPNGTQTKYELEEERGEQNGSASIEPVMPGVYSVLLGDRTFLVNVAQHPEGLEVWVGLERHLISLSDPRDRPARQRTSGVAGPIEIRAQMPGKIIKVMIAEGTHVSAGEGLLVIEAMKMQNEVKAPKDGVLRRIHVSEGSTVNAGEPLVVVE